MEIKKKIVMVLGGYGEVGIAICRQILRHHPKALIVTSLNEHEATSAASELLGDDCRSTNIIPFYGNLFVRNSLKDINRKDILSSPELTKQVIDDVMNEFSEQILTSSALYQLITKFRPHIIVDAITTASALSYANLYNTYEEIKNDMGNINGRNDHVYAIDRLLSTTTIPFLVRHIQILYETMQRSGTQIYLKIGTTGTGGMGVNIPFTHGEKTPSRLLLTKAAVAGAHTMLLFALNRTPGLPLIREIKPAAMIGWKAMGAGRISISGRMVPLYDCSLENAFVLKQGETFQASSSWTLGNLPSENMEGFYVDTGENGIFSIDEFKAITSIGMMEFVTPEEIAQQVIFNILGTESSSDIIASIESSVMNPSYRAGILRQSVIKNSELHENEGITYGFLGPFVSKLVFEATLLKLCYETIDKVAKLSPKIASRTLEEYLGGDVKTRIQAISLGIPILLPDGKRLLCVRRHVADKEWELKEWIVDNSTIDRFASTQWVDLRPLHIARWIRNLSKLLNISTSSESNTSSRFNRGSLSWGKNKSGKILIDPGEVTAWMLIHEYKGGRIGIYGNNGSLLF